MSILSLSELEIYYYYYYYYDMLVRQNLLIANERLMGNFSENLPNCLNFDHLKIMSKFSILCKFGLHLLSINHIKNKNKLCMASAHSKLSPMKLGLTQSQICYMIFPCLFTSQRWHKKDHLSFFLNHFRP